MSLSDKARYTDHSIRLAGLNVSDPNLFKHGWKRGRVAFFTDSEIKKAVKELKDWALTNSIANWKSFTPRKVNEKIDEIFGSKLI